MGKITIIDGFESNETRCTNIEEETTFSIPENKYECEMFGTDCWTWQSPTQPNWFWRWMQYICFGNKWRKR